MDTLQEIYKELSNYKIKRDDLVITSGGKDDKELLGNIEDIIIPAVI